MKLKARHMTRNLQMWIWSQSGLVDRCVRNEICFSFVTESVNIILMYYKFAIQYSAVFFSEYFATAKCLVMQEPFSTG